jgi:FAD/FMN-containing dehydrogenase
MQSTMSFGIGLYTMIPERDRPLAGRVAETMSRCLDRCRDLGGRPYRYGWHQIDGAMERALYGSAVDRLAEIRGVIDPDGVLRQPPPTVPS